MKMNVAYDDRGWGSYDILPVPQGQVNYGYTYKGVVRAFHKHNRQTDNWVCVKGVLRAVTIKGSPDDKDVEISVTYLREGDGNVLSIPSGIWHGYQSIGGDAALVYYVTEKYDPNNPDEDRTSWDFNGKYKWEVEYK
jgi:dTDP-4-dehydrorhamnose 3,5-epimerase